MQHSGGRAGGSSGRAGGMPQARGPGRRSCRRTSRHQCPAVGPAVRSTACQRPGPVPGRRHAAQPPTGRHVPCHDHQQPAAGQGEGHWAAGLPCCQAVDGEGRDCHLWLPQSLQREWVRVVASCCPEIATVQQVGVWGWGSWGSWRLQEYLTAAGHAGRAGRQPGRRGHSGLGPAADRVRVPCKESGLGMGRAPLVARLQRAPAREVPGSTRLNLRGATEAQRHRDTEIDTQ